MRNPNLCSLVCCPVPCQVDGTPVLCISASAALPYVRVCFVVGDVSFSLYDDCYYFAPLSLPSLGSLVPSLPHQLDIQILVRFFELCVAALLFVFFSFLGFGLLGLCISASAASPYFEFVSFLVAFGLFL